MGKAMGSLAGRLSASMSGFNWRCGSSKKTSLSETGCGTYPRLSPLICLARLSHIYSVCLCFHIILTILNVTLADDRHIDNLVLSFRKMWLYEIRPSKLRPVPINTNSDTH